MDPFGGRPQVDFAPAGKAFAERLTPAQRKTLRTMMLEKAELKQMDLEQADDTLDEWFKDMTKQQASREIRRCGVWLDRERARRGLVRT